MRGYPQKRRQKKTILRHWLFQASVMNNDNDLNLHDMTKLSGFATGSTGVM